MCKIVRYSATLLQNTTLNLTLTYALAMILTLTPDPNSNSIAIPHLYSAFYRTAQRTGDKKLVCQRNVQEAEPKPTVFYIAPCHSPIRLKYLL